jgi:Mn2+/Fe2+ NRAMP family transporter
MFLHQVLFIRHYHPGLLTVSFTGQQLTNYARLAGKETHRFTCLYLLSSGIIRTQQYSFFILSFFILFCFFVSFYFSRSCAPSLVLFLTWHLFSQWVLFICFFLCLFVINKTIYIDLNEKGHELEIKQDWYTERFVRKKEKEKTL